MTYRRSLPRRADVERAVDAGAAGAREGQRFSADVARSEAVQRRAGIDDCSRG